MAQPAGRRGCRAAAPPARLKRAELLLWEKEGEEAAAAVEEIRQGLQGGGGAGVGAGPCDGVEVAVVRYRW